MSLVNYVILRAGGALYGTFCTYIENNCTKPACFRGITGDVWDTLRHVLNFTYTIFENQAWGSLESDSGHSSWNGLIGIIDLLTINKLNDKIL